MGCEKCAASLSVFIGLVESSCRSTVVVRVLFVGVCPLELRGCVLGGV